ncbi:MAG: putative metal-dependent hydrolase, TIM-barrel fold [Hyphomicrobiales bacterium]|nr:putative metal-dependent hydrolase, TIM-barrel fold [Hyphomicrobiales bacterium]
MSQPSGIVDMHAHWFPEELCEGLRRRSVVPRIVRKDDGAEFLESSFNSSPIPGREDIETRLAHMDKQGVEHAVLSLTGVYGIERLPGAESTGLCGIFNDAVAAACAKHPARLSGFAALPVAEIGATVAEFERAMALPGMIGAVLPGDGFLSRKRAEHFRPLFEAANRLGAVFQVHYGKMANDPEAPKVDASDNPHSRVGTLDMQARLSSNMVTFCMTDFLDAFPNVTVLSHNLGGNIPYEIDRLDHRSLLDRPGDVLPSRRMRESGVMVDCNSLGSKPIELAVEVYGAHRIVFGSDGTDFGMDWTRKAIAQARIPEADKQAILWRNAQRLLARVRGAGAAAAE